MSKGRHRARAAKRRAREKETRYRSSTPPPCRQCGLRESHFVPPSAGDPGFFICIEGDLEQRRAKRDAERIDLVEIMRIVRGE